MQMHPSYFDCSFSEIRQSMGVLATADELPGDEAFTIVMVFERENWGKFDLKNLAATSIYRGDTHTWVVGIDGEIVTIYQGKITKEYLPDSGSSGRHLGRPNRIRSIDGCLYVCGFAGQVYTQGAMGQWLHMDDGLAEPEGTARSIDLEDIGGTSANNLYAVGSGGLVAHWNGKQWKRIPLLTNAYLAAVRCVAPDCIVAVGDKGTFVEGDGKKWRVEVIPGCEELSLSDVEVYQDRIYVAAVEKLMVREAGRWSEVNTALPKKRTKFLKLTRGAGKLWAMGSKCMNSFDGKSWMAHPDPDNG